MAVNGFDDAKNKVSVYTTVEIDTNKQDKHITAQITLYAATWINDPEGAIQKVQIIQVPGVTETNTVLVSPVWLFAEEYNSCKVFCLDQLIISGQGCLKFACDPDNVPENDLIVNVLILGD